MGRNSARRKHCKRCKKPVDDGVICQSCKSDLLGHYEASHDWQTAYEIEKAQLTAQRYSNFDAEDNDYPY